MSPFGVSRVPDSLDKDKSAPRFSHPKTHHIEVPFSEHLLQVDTDAHLTVNRSGRSSRSRQRRRTRSSRSRPRARRGTFLKAYLWAISNSKGDIRHRELGKDHLPSWLAWALVRIHSRLFIGTGWIREES